MIILTLIIFLGLFFLVLGYPAFESALAFLIAVTALVHLPALVYGPQSGVYWVVSLFLLALFFVTRDRPSVNFSFAKHAQRELPTLGVFVVIYTAAYLLSLSWPDFIAIGERLRDYAILASIIHNPSTPMEPWMSGATLNYYVFWYRFGALLSRLFGLQIWDVYHMLAAFSIAFYFTVIYRIFNRFVRLSLTNSLIVALLITFGSNISGIGNALFADQNWWGPSRVIKGAINEFPAWSFLLGDLHPHYLNLAFVPFVILIFLHTVSHRSQVFSRFESWRVTLLLAILTLVPLWLYNSNVWEIPMWLGIVGVFLSLALLSSRGTIFWILIRQLRELKSYFNFKLGLWFVVVILLALSLLFSSAHITPTNQGSLAFVSSPIERTTTLELLQHWGFPIILISICNIALISSNLWRGILGVFLCLGAFSGQAPAFLLILLLTNLVRLLHAMGFDGPRARHLDSVELTFETLGLSGLGLILIPEIFFLNDDYGGENERMNTIFKIYTTAWFLVHGFGFYLIKKLFKDGPRLADLRIGWFVGRTIVLVLFLSFSAFVVLDAPSENEPDPMRRSRPATVLPAAEGLSTVERMFPGSALVIRALRTEPAAVVLEAQGNPYSYTTFVSTLSGQTSYLGWANHVNLLTKNYEEVGRREKFTESFYQERDCERKKQMLISEGINYVVFGNLEKDKYPSADVSQFSCLFLAFSDQNYYIFKAK